MKSIRICKFPDCITKLNRYNKDNFCGLHHKLLVQNEVHFDRRYFVFARKGQKAFRKYIPLITIKRLKYLMEEW